METRVHPKKHEQRGIVLNKSACHHFSDPAEIRRQYRYWRFRLTYALIVGYAAYYLIRQNFTMLRTSDKCPFSMEAIGWAFSAFSVVYGVFKMVAGSICDRSDARLFMPVGLALAACCSLLAGCWESSVVFGTLYAVNAVFQSMGWPSVSRTLTQWFGPQQIGTRWGIINCSHQIGSIVVLVGGAKLLEYGSWRLLFIIPAIISLFLSLWVWERLRDTPESIGLPSVEEFEHLPVVKTEISENASNESFGQMFRNHILHNGRLWLVCIANFFVYFVRSGLLCWGPVLIVQTQKCTVMEAGLKFAGTEVGGLFGGLFIGWFTDKFMHTRRGLCGCLMMMLMGVVMGFYWACNTVWQETIGQIFITCRWVDYLFWFCVGFFVYGSQVLGGLSGAEFGSKKAAATGAAMTGTFGYLAASASGIGLVKLSDAYGWQSVYLTFLVASFLGGLFFMLTLKKPKRERY